MNSTTNRILVAEDHYVSRHLLERNLQNWGFEVITAEDGETAAEILAGPEAPAIAILAWMMPRMDGAEVCQRVRQNRGPYIYLLMLTAKSQKDEVAAGLDA